MFLLRSCRALNTHAVRSASMQTRSASSLSALTPAEVVTKMQENGLHRAYFVHDKDAKKVVASDPIFDEVAIQLQNDKVITTPFAGFKEGTQRDFHEHEAVFLEIGAYSNYLLGASVHCTTRGQAAGGVRYWNYDNFYDYIVDGLRLAEGMGRKNALAGLWWGGGKGGIAREATEDGDSRVCGQPRWLDPDFRKLVFREYGTFMTSLQGCYVTAEDVGATMRDMGEIFRHTRFTSCISPAQGGSGNPSIATGWGVVCGMEGALDALGMGTIEGKRVVIQGAGNVARPMAQRLLDLKVGSLLLSDVSERQVAGAKAELGDHPNVDYRVVPRGDNTILYEEADIVSPCALGGTLNKETIPNIKAAIVCGAANNQLLDDQTDGELLQKQGCTYVPDFLANRMGIVNCANEQYGFVNNDPAIERHFGREWDNAIFVVTKKVLAMAEEKGITTGEAACAIADELMTHDHPIWPDRPRQVIASLVENGWDKLPRGSIF